MMGYEGRSLLLDDGEEWVNIPFVVREFMRQLNDEVHASRSMVESLRHEQKEVSLLLRRVMQKQSDLEMDNARNTLSLQRATSSNQDTAHKRHTEQIHYLRKKQEKLDEKVQLLERDLGKATQKEDVARFGPSNGDLADQINSLYAEVGNCKKDLAEQREALREAQRTSDAAMSSCTAAAIDGVDAALNAKFNSVEMRLSSAEKAVGVHQAAIEKQQQESRSLRGLCGDFSDMIEKDRQVNKERLTTCLQMIEKVETLCAAQQNGMEVKLEQMESAIEAGAKQTRDDAKTSYIELRDLVKSEQHETIRRCNELAEELLSVKQQQKRFQEQLEQCEMDCVAQRALKLTKELSTRVTDLEANAEQYVQNCLPRSEYQRHQREDQESVSALKVLHEETKVAFQVQIQKLDQTLKTLRNELGEDNDWLHNELRRLGTMLSYGTQQREKHETQVTSLCDIVHNLSVAVEVLQTAQAKGTNNNTGSKARAASTDVASQSAPFVIPASSTTPAGSANADASVLSIMEAWRTQITKELETKLSVASTVQQRCERLSHQLNELTAKVDGGARFAQSVASQYVEQVRQSVKDEVQLQLQAHATLRELTPALVELEAVKRRMAGLELDMQSASTSAERRRADGTDGFSDASAASPDLLRRVIFIEDSLEGFKRRLLELGEHVMEFEQHRNNATRTMHQFELRLQDQERVVGKLGTDLTAALEGLLHTEESLSLHQKTTVLRMEELQTLTEGCKAEITALADASADEAVPSSTLDVTQNRIDHLQTQLTTLSAAIEQMTTKAANEALLRLRTFEAELVALRQECAAATIKQTAETARCTEAVTEALAREQSETTRVREELQESLSNNTSMLRGLAERLNAVEAAALHTSTPSPPSSLPSYETYGPIPLSALSSEVKAALARCTDDLHACHRRLDAQQQRMGTLGDEVLSSVEERCAALRREWQVKVDTFRDEVMAWVATHVASQTKSSRSEELRALVDDAVHRSLSKSQRAVASEAELDAEAKEVGAAQLRQLVHDVQQSLERRFSDMAAAQRQELNDVMRHVESAQVSSAELRREMRDAIAAQQEDRDTVVQELRDALDELKDSKATLSVSATSPSAPLPLTNQRSPKPLEKEIELNGKENEKAWKEDVLHSIHEDFYSKSLLEERLENIWSSMISLLSRKEDVTAVNEKLNGLHQLMQEELHIAMERLEDQLAGQLAEKANLTSLQDIFEEHFVDPHGTV